MAKKCMIEREKKRTKFRDRYAKKRDALRVILNDPKASYEDKMIALKKFRRIPRAALSTRGRNRCGLTGRPRGYSRKFGLCRNMIRKLFNMGFFPGVHKASW